MNWLAGYSDSGMRFYPGKLQRDVEIDGQVIPARSRPDEQTSARITELYPDAWGTDPDHQPRSMPVLSLRTTAKA